MNKEQDNSEFISDNREAVAVFPESQEHKQVRPAKKRSSIVWVIRFIAQLFVMALILFGAFTAMNKMIASKPEIAQRPVFPSTYTIDSVIAKSAMHQPILTLYGEIVAGRSVDLRSLVSGEVVSISEKLKAGGFVEKGEALVEIDRFSYEGALREAKANEAEIRAKIDENNASTALEQSRLISNRDQLELAKSDLERIEQLRKKGTATAKQLDDRALLVSQRAQSVQQSEINIISSKAKLAQQQAALDRILWKIEQSERNLNDTVLEAPFSGTIRSNQIEIGKVVGANDVIVSMYQTNNLEARFVLTDERFGRIQADSEGLIGRKISVIWAVGGTNHEYSGKIDRIGAEIQSARGGVEIYATIDNNNNKIKMRPGAFVEVKIPDQAFQNHIALPDTAIYNGETVYIVVDKKLVKKNVLISSYDGESALIASGIKQGDEVLVTRISEVSQGLRVRKEGDPIVRRGGANKQKKAYELGGNATKAERRNGNKKGEGRKGKRKSNQNTQ